MYHMLQRADFQRDCKGCNENMSEYMRSTMKQRPTVLCNILLTFILYPQRYYKPNIATLTLKECLPFSVLDQQKPVYVNNGHAGKMFALFF